MRQAKDAAGGQATRGSQLLTDSVLRNPDAILLFSKLWEKGDYTQSHALDCSIYMAAFGRFLEMSRDDIVLLGYLACCKTWQGEAGPWG